MSNEIKVQDRVGLLTVDHRSSMEGVVEEITKISNQGNKGNNKIYWVRVTFPLKYAAGKSIPRLESELRKLPPPKKINSVLSR